MIFTELLVFLATIAGLALSAHLAITGTGRVRMLAGAAAVGIAAVSQQFLIYAIAGGLLVLIGVLRRKSKNPVHRKLAPVNILAGLVMIGYAFYMYW